jgi:hypothetical protein
VLRSLKTIRKETAMMAMVLGRSSPDPRLGSMVELSRGNARGLLDFVWVGKALPGQGIAAEEPPPALLQVEPARSCRNEDLVEPWMLGEPGPRLSTAVAGEIVSDDVNVPVGIVGFDALKQSYVVRRVARSGASGQFLAIAYAQRSIDPGLLGVATVIQRRFDAVTSGGPARGWWKGSGNYWPEFVGADGRRTLGRLGVVADDRCPFGTKSLSVLVPQLCVRRQRTPSRSKMVRI